MEFRWIALIALWTLVSGPIVGVPTGPASPSEGKKATANLVKVPPPASSVGR